MLSDKLISDHFGEQILTIMMMSSPPKRTNGHLPVGPDSKSSPKTKISNVTPAIKAKGSSPVEYGPQLPKQSSQEEVQTSGASAGIVSWGKEPYGSPGFSWFKFLTRTTVELLLVTGISIAVAMFLNSNTSKSNISQS